MINIKQEIPSDVYGRDDTYESERLLVQEEFVEIRTVKEEPLLSSTGDGESGKVNLCQVNPSGHHPFDASSVSIKQELPTDASEPIQLKDEFTTDVTVQLSVQNVYLVPVTSVLSCDIRQVNVDLPTPVKTEPGPRLEQRESGVGGPPIDIVDIVPNYCTSTASSSSQIKNVASVNMSTAPQEGVQFVYNHNLVQQHLRNYNGKPPVKCLECHKVFERAEDLKQHYFRHKDKNKKLLCEDCGIVCRNKMHYRSHCEGHVGAVLFKCKACGAMYNSENKLSRHLKTHSEIQTKFHVCKKPPVKGLGCDKAFNRAEDLKKHYLRHKDENEQLRCEDCGFVCRNKTDYRNHCEGHVGAVRFKCEACGVVYNTANELKWDFQTPCEIQFKCLVCEPKLSSESRLHFRSRTQCDAPHLQPNSEPVPVDVVLLTWNGTNMGERILSNSSV